MKNKAINPNQLYNESMVKFQNQCKSSSTRNIWSYFSYHYISNDLQSGILSSLPFLCQVVVIFFAGPITDYMLKKKYLSVLLARKINTSISLMGLGLFIVLAGYSGCNATLVVVYFCLSSGLNGFSGKFIYPGYLILTNV